MCVSAVEVKLGNDATIHFKMCDFLLVSNRQLVKMLLKVKTAYDFLL